MTMLLRSLLVAVALAALAATSASAQTPTPTPALADLKPCYVAAQEEQREPVQVIGSGFTGGKTVDVLVDELEQFETPPTTNFDGTLNGTVRAPFIEEGERPFTLRVTERDNGAHSVTKASRVTRLSVEQRPARAATRERVTFRGRGFTEPLTPVYAHYVFAGKSQKTVRLGVPTGPCGVFSIKRRQFPFKNSPRRGVWTIQFDQVKTYNPKAAVHFRLTVRVSKRLKPERARAR
jgi:hypothetical protein